MRARDVLEDCKQALKDFEASGATPYWRTRWIGLVALLRSVGHVLDKIDGAQTREWRKAVDEAWEKLKRTKPEPRILWEFIEAERNNVLKAYDVGARLNVTFRPGPAVLSFSDSIARHQKSDATLYEFVHALRFLRGSRRIGSVSGGFGFLGGVPCGGRGRCDMTDR